MTKTEIFASLSQIRDELIQAHKHLDSAQFMIDHTKEELIKDIQDELHRG